MGKSGNNLDSPSKQTGDDYRAAMAELRAQVQQQRAQIEALTAEVRAGAREIAQRRLAAPAADGLFELDAQQQPELDTQAQPDIHAYFEAVGPASSGLSNIGFRADYFGQFRIGVRGVGSDVTNGSRNTFGVVGASLAEDGYPADGTGVLGNSGGGTGVVGVSRDGTGVLGSSDTGTGVEGLSNAGLGVLAFGVRGFGSIGVQGVSEHIGVLGGDPDGPNADPNVFIGVAGQVPADPEGFTFSYGGWFGRGPGGQGGTAPLHLEPANAQDPNPPAAAQRGDLFADHAGLLWFCTDTGDNNPTSAMWRKVQLA